MHACASRMGHAKPQAAPAPALVRLVSQRQTTNCRWPVAPEHTPWPYFDDNSLTENTRVAYPLDYIPGAVIPSVGGHPKVIIFLTADALGVLPPVSRLTNEGAMYHFMSGYTSKLAGTERGIKEPKAVFSECFAAPFMPRPASVYAKMELQSIQKEC